jgi:hypothetical protein
VLQETIPEGAVQSARGSLERVTAFAADGGGPPGEGRSLKESGKPRHNDAKATKKSPLHSIRASYLEGWARAAWITSSVC